MREFPVQRDMIQIASVGGERRLISVSGLSKVRLLWLFRNFRILDFSVLNSKQQRFIAQAWNAGTSANADAEDPFDLIGCIDGFLPKLYPPGVLVAEKPDHLRASFSSLNRLRTPAIWTVVILIGSAIYLVPKHRIIPQTPVAAATANPVSVPVQSAPPIPDSAPEVPVVQLPMAAPEVPSVAAVPPPRSLPNAMASDASSPQGTPPETQVRSKPAGKREVMIRVSVNHDGRAERFEVLQGDRERIAAALIAAQAWHFQPCSSADICEHRLRITNYEDASIVQMID